jgi:hypothetical protein
MSVKAGDLIVHAYWTDGCRTFVVPTPLRPLRVERVERVENFILGETDLYHCEGGRTYSVMSAIKLSEAKEHLARN